MVFDPAKMGRLNQRMLLWRLQRIGVASRAELAKSLGMSQPTAGKIVDELLRLDILEEVEESGSGNGVGNNGMPVRLGRPGRMLRLNQSYPRFLAIQLGISETCIACLPLGATQEDTWTERMATPNSPEQWVRQLARLSTRLPSRGLWGILVSVPGIVDETEGRIVFSPNLHWTEQSQLPAMLHQVWKIPVVLVQEERALALGHQYLTPVSEDFLLVDFGEGVGGAVINGGKLYTNPLPISGELGHTPVLGNSRKCGCGAVGCLETLASTRGLQQSLAQVQQTKTCTWSDLQKWIAKHGIEPWLQETLAATSIVISGALNVLGLRHVIITGNLTELPNIVIAALRNLIRDGSLWARFGTVEVEAAPRRRTAGLVSVGIDRLVLPMAGPLARP
jgi:predicted NBD/HSP70 family sugar kinase